MLNKILDQSIEQKSILALRQTDTLSKSIFIDAGNWAVVRDKLVDRVEDFHHSYPLKAGMPREQLKTLSDLSQENFDLTLDRLSLDGLLIQKGTLVWASAHEVKLTPEQEQIVTPVMAEFETNPFSPPDINQLTLWIVARPDRRFDSSGRLVSRLRLVIFTPTAIQEMRNWVKEYIGLNGELSLSQFRDHFKTSRKYAASALEFFDEIGFTYRKGDVRALR